MEKILQLYTYVDGGINDTPFPNSDNPIEIGAFRYDAKRMGGAPTITASVNYPSCLDGVWTDNVYAEFNHEKYFLKQIPTSSYDNADVMYKHEVTLVSERAVLDDVYFFDVVTGNPSESDKPVSNSTKVTFFGDIKDFVSRLNASLEYSGLDYEVVVDDKITTEEKLMSFEDQFFSNVLQEIYNTYEVPYYFDGKTIHIGFAKSDVVVPDLSYGVDNALLSITKNNANYKTVNRATGYGSTDNLTFYYPNNAPKGQLDVTIETTSDDLSVRIKDYEKFSDEMKIGDVFSFVSNNVNITNGTSESSVEFTTAGTPQTNSYRFESLVLKDEFVIDCRFPCRRVLKFIPTNSLEYIAYGENHMNNSIMETIRQPITYAFHYGVARLTNIGTEQIDIKKIGELEFEVDLSKGTNTLSLALEFKAGYHNFLPIGDVHELNIEGECLWEMSVEGEDSAWRFGDDTINLEDYGLVATGTPSEGDTIAQTLVKYVNTSKNLMPSIYRQSAGKERFYNAVNYPYSKPEGFEINKVFLGADGYWRNEIGEYEIEGIIHNDAYKDDEGIYIHFDHPYVEGKAKEHIVAVEDLKPTIKEAVNSMGLRMDMFSEFAYDDDDSDETEENEDGSDRDFVHSYFFAKLRKLDFNLFECAIEQQPMTISFTSGDCGACNFEIGVTEEFPQKNPVRVNPDGTLMRDANGRVICGQFEPIYENEIQDRQQDTINNEVWIALRKEEDTYGELMPKAPVGGVGGHRPKACSEGSNDGDTFVILGINLPEEYVTRQERQLEKDIIKYIKDNNEEKFTFSIGFSRIYFAENENILKNLSENSKVRIFYNNLPYDLYVSSFSYNLNAGDVLPDIKIELDETLKISQNPIQKAISQVKSQLGNALRNIDVVGAGTPYFLRKDVDDEVIGRVNFRKGVKFGEGGKVEVLDNNSAKLTIEYLEVTKKASFTSLEIQEKTHVGGQILVTPAAINCGEVEEFEDFYRCYFQTKGVEGDEIFNQFAMDDQAICQTYNTWGSRYYWRKVVGIGEDYIDLSKVAGEYDEDSDIPMAGDKIIQLGNQSDATRQNAIVIAAYGDGSPYIIQYKGINSFEIGDDKIVTKLSSTENIFTGKVHMELGSDGLDALPEWIEVKNTANEALEKVDAMGENTFAELEAYINEVRDDLQGQIDGAIDSYFYEYAPNNDNVPAKDWDTEEEKEAHLNDTFTNLKDGRSWRWTKDTNNVYSWTEITDTATSEALALAGKAQETADGKMTVFMSQPTPPYKAGDLWAGGEDQPLKRCVYTRESGSYDATDWALADNAQAYADAIKEELEKSIEENIASIDKTIAETEKAANDYTDEAKKALQSSIDTLNSAKANLSDVYTKAKTDDLITKAENDAIKAAEDLANAARNLAETNVKAWANGEIDEAEEAAIAEAERKVNEAKEEMAKYTDDAIDEVAISGTNLLRNSGFTGDYLSEQLSDNKVLDAAEQLYSSPFEHWTHTGATVIDATEAISGKAVKLSSGEISQVLYYKTVFGADYVLSFKAKGSGSLSYTIGNASGSVTLTDTWKEFEVVANVKAQSNTFKLSGTNCTIGNLKLEKGNKSTSWSASPLDNASDRAYYQSLKYLQNAFEGATDVNGGLVLTEQIQVGDYDKDTKEWVKMSGGMSGIYEDDTDVAFWAGGNLEKAITAVSKYENDPTYQPSQEELATMAKFVVTHGGRAILEDAIVRGTIYARDGQFTGTVNATSGVFNNVDVQTGKIANFDINGNSLGIQEEVGGNGMSLYDKYISFYENNTQEKIELLARIGAYEGADTYQHVAEFENKSTNILDSMGGTGFGVCSDVSGYTNSYAFASKKGMFAGFRPHVAILGSDNSPLQLGKYHHTILALYGGTIVLDGTPENGQEYEIICPNTSVEEGRVQIITNDGTGNIYLMLDGIKRSGFSAHDLGGTRQVIKLVYFAQDRTWFAWHHTY